MYRRTVILNNKGSVDSRSRFGNCSKTEFNKFNPFLNLINIQQQISGKNSECK